MLYMYNARYMKIMLCMRSIVAAIDIFLMRDDAVWFSNYTKTFSFPFFHCGMASVVDARHWPGPSFAPKINAHQPSGRDTLYVCVYVPYIDIPP